MDTGYIIDKNNAELRWLVYSTSEDWDKGQAAPYIADYCYVVKKVFENIFGVDYVNSHKNLAVIYSADYPIIFRECYSNLNHTSAAHTTPPVTGVLPLCTRLRRVRRNNPPWRSL